MSILETIKNRPLYFDGGTGTVLQSLGLTSGELPETWNIKHPELITKLHYEYLSAGCDIIKTNTFGANSLKFRDDLDSIVLSALECAKNAVKQFDDKKRYIALDIGPLGKLLKPLGELDFEDAVNIFAETIKIGTNAGADLILIETMNDSYETKAAVLAAKENSNLPVFVTNVYDDSAKLMTGADAVSMIALLEGLKVDAIGLNCSLGPKQMLDIVPIFAKYSSLPIIVNPNAGLPRSENGKTVFDVSAEEFSDLSVQIVNAGAHIIGGCCGTNPEYIKKAIEKTKNITPKPVTKKEYTLISSYSRFVEIGKEPVLIGERINPTGKKRFKEALNANDIGYILNEGIRQEKEGVHILDVNVGLPEIDEPQMMLNVIKELQAVTDLPLQIDTSDPKALEVAMRAYNGKPLVNSVNGKEESLSTVLPLVAKYGGVVIALTLDENGIPQTADERLKIAKKIVDRAIFYGIDKKDIIADPLALTISSEPESAKVTLESIEKIKKELSIKTSLGVSNISFGLPNRDLINSTFFALALQRGLDAAIMNPFSADMMKTYYSFLALEGLDKNCEKYIDFASSFSVQNVSIKTGNQKLDTADGLKGAVINGLKEEAAKITSELLKTEKAMDIINSQLIPALDEVGKGFEEKTVYLPQLLMSAEAATSAFNVIKDFMGASNQSIKKDKIILATVKGDIHDIGKNIVKVLLENYGYDVIDLGKDVSIEIVVDTATKENVRLVGLSALMTTTVPAMEATIKALNKALPDCKVVVGGAVLTKEYADQIGADFYAKDAMETVRFAEKFFKE